MNLDSSNKETKREFYVDEGLATVSLHTLAIDCTESDDLFGYLEAEHELKLTREHPGRSRGTIWRVKDVGSFRLWESESGTNKVRYEFNLQGPEVSAARLILRDLLRSNGIVRVDAPIDYQLDLSDHLFDKKRVHRETHTNSQGRVESMGFGMRSCPLFIRAYDKQLESHLDSPLWRIEAECKSKPRRDLRADLFDGLMVYSWPPKADLRWMENAALHLAHAHPGIQRAYSTRTRVRVDGLIADHLEPLTPSPADAYRAALPQLQRDLDNLLGGARPAIRAGPMPMIA